jgi:hypothetical protein
MAYDGITDKTVWRQGIVEYSVTFVTLVGLLTLRLRPKSPEGNTSRVVYRVPWLLILVASAATAVVVSISVARHSIAGIGFLAFGVASAGIYRRIIRA